MAVDMASFCLFRMIQTDDFLYHVEDIKNMEIMIYKEKNGILNLEDRA